jgi:alcohol dehydrogenase
MTQTDNTTFFAQPKFLVGSRALEHIPVELDGYNAKRPMVITNQKNKKKYLKHLTCSLAESNVTIGALYDETHHYVNIQEIKRLVGFFNWRQCDSIIALGGEAVLNTAKAIAVSLSDENDFSKIASPLIPIVYIATTYLNGKEVTNSVNIDGKEFFSNFLFPDIVCIDKRMAASTENPSQLIYAALDSLAHCVEGAAQVPINPFVDASTYTAIQLIAENLPLFVKKPSNNKAALAIINGISVAGTVRSNSQGSLACLSAEVIANKTGYPRGMISGALLPLALRFKLDNNLIVRDNLLLALCGIDKYCSVPESNKVSEAVKELENLNSILSAYLPKSLKDIKLQEHLIQKVAAQANEISNGKVSEEHCFRFLRTAFEN